MSTQLLEQPAATTPAAPTSYKLSFFGAVKSEIIKLFSLRSTLWAAAIILVMSLGFTVVYTLSELDSVPAGAYGNEAFQSAITPISMLTMVLALLMGVLNITGEYSTGMIRSTMTAAPDRLRAFAAKMLVIGSFVFLLSLVASVLSLLLQVVLVGDKGAYDITNYGTGVWPYLAAACMLALIALFGLGLGFVIRNGAGAIAIGIVALWVLPTVLGLMSMIPSLNFVGEWLNYLPMQASMNAIALYSDVDAGSAWLTLAVWAVVPLVAGAALLKTRDV